MRDRDGADFSKIHHFGVTQIDNLDTQYLAAVRIDEFFARAIDLPLAAQAGSQSLGKTDVACAEDHAPFAGTDQHRCIIQYALFDDQRPAQERGDGRCGNARDGIVNTHVLAAFRRESDDAARIADTTRIPCTGRTHLTDTQCAAAAVEKDHVARVYPVRVFDGVLVHAPDIGPFPRVCEEFAGNIPQRVALDDDVPIGSVRADLKLIGTSQGRQQKANQRYNLAHWKLRHSQYYFIRGHAKLLRCVKFCI